MMGSALYKIVVGFLSNAPLPVMVFVTYAHFHGNPDIDRWAEAFLLGAIAALLQMIYLFILGDMKNRIIVGVNVYLILGGIAVVTNQEWLLQALNILQETGLMIVVVGLGILTTFCTKAGYIGIEKTSKITNRHYSLLLLAASLLGLSMTVPFRGDPLLAGFIPIVGLIALQKILILRINTAPVLGEPG